MKAGPPRSICAVGATLGEGPVWVPAEGILWFVDIKTKRIYRFAPETGDLKSWCAPAQPGWILPVQDGRMMVGLQTGLHMFCPKDGSFSLVRDPEPDRPGNRLNDATVDCLGRLWFGTMDDAEEQRTGRVYCFDNDVVPIALIDPVTIANGPACSPDGNRLYHVDTLGGTIHVFDMGEDGELTGGRVFATVSPDDGYPDGPVVDSAGCLWVGLFGGWGVRRYAPDGSLLDHVRFPTANVTKMAFGGDDLKTVYATTARKGLSPADLAEQPHAGDLFAFAVDVPGVALPAVRWGG